VLLVTNALLAVLLVAGAVYDDEKAIIYVHPQHLSSNVMAHELGHHVINIHGDADILTKAGYVLSHTAFLEDSSQICQAYGLRFYSFSDSHEFLADSFMIRTMGTKTQWEGLVEYTKRHGDGLDLEKLFGG